MTFRYVCHICNIYIYNVYYYVDIYIYMCVCHSYRAGSCLRHGVPQVTLGGFNTQMVIHDLDDLGYPHDFGNLHITTITGDI